MSIISTRRIVLSLGATSILGMSVACGSSSGSTVDRSHGGADNAGSDGGGIGGSRSDGGAIGGSGSTGRGGRAETTGMICSSGAGGPSICTEKSTFSSGEDITVRFSGGPGKLRDWIAVYPSDCCSTDCPGGSTLWKYCPTNSHDATSSGVTSGTVVIDSAGNPDRWPLTNGSWQMFYLVDDGYSPIAKLTFDIVGGEDTKAVCGKIDTCSLSGAGEYCEWNSDCCSDSCYLHGHTCN